MVEKVIRIDGAIGDFGNTAEEFQARLSELALSDSDDLKVIINSVGGSVFEGFNIYNSLKTLPNKVTVKIEGLAASIATLIALAGDTVQMSEVSMFMIHNASTFVQGNKEDLEKQMETLETIDNTLKTVYASKTGEKPKVIAEWMKETKWFDSKEAKRIGFVDEIVDKIDSKMAAQIQDLNKNDMKNLKEYFKASLETVTGTGEANPDVVADAAKIEADAKLEEEAKLKETAEADAKYATKEELENLTKAVTNLVDEIQKNQETSKTEQVQAVEAKFTALVKGLPKTEGAAPAAAGDLNEDPSAAYVDPFAKFRAEQKDINKKTRN